MKLTYADTEMIETPKGGFKASTLALLGVDWPPAKGWRNSLVGEEVPEELFLEAVMDSELPPLPKSERKARLRECKEMYRQCVADGVDEWINFQLVAESS